MILFPLHIRHLYILRRGCYRRHTIVKRSPGFIRPVFDFNDDSAGFQGADGVPLADGDVQDDYRAAGREFDGTLFLPQNLSKAGVRMLTSFTAFTRAPVSSFTVRI